MKKFILISAIILLIGAGKSFAYTFGETIIGYACPYKEMNWQPQGSPLTFNTPLTATLYAIATCGKYGNAVVAAQRASGTWEYLMSSSFEGQKTATWQGTWIKCEIVMSNPEVPNNIQGPVYGVLQYMGL